MITGLRERGGLSRPPPETTRMLLIVINRQTDVYTTLCRDVYSNSPNLVVVGGVA